MVNDLIRPDCRKPIMNMQKVENLLRTTTSKTLISRCRCSITLMRSDL